MNAISPTRTPDSKKRALIFGISGQDGAYLAKLLIEKGYDVTGVSRDAQLGGFRNLIQLGILDSVRLESASLHDFRSVLHVITKTEPDEVYNLAGQSSVSLSFSQPVETFESISIATLNLLEVIRFLGGRLRLYNACSGECFGDTGGRAADETTPFRPRSPYGVAKAAAFWEVANYREAYGIYACSGILFNHESPLRPERFVTRKIVAAAVRIAAGKGKELTIGDTSVLRDWGWAPEYVDAMWRMLQQEAPADFVIATGESNSLESFIQSVFNEVGLDPKAHIVIDASLLRPSEIRVSRANPSKAEAKLGWRSACRMRDVVKKLVDAEQARALR